MLRGEKKSPKTHVLKMASAVKVFTEEERQALFARCGDKLKVLKMSDQLKVR